MEVLTTGQALWDILTEPKTVGEIVTALRSSPTLGNGVTIWDVINSMVNDGLIIRGECHVTYTDCILRRATPEETEKVEKLKQEILEKKCEISALKDQITAKEREIISITDKMWR